MWGPPYLLELVDARIADWALWLINGGPIAFPVRVSLSGNRRWVNCPAGGRGAGREKKKGRRHRAVRCSLSLTLRYDNTGRQGIIGAPWVSKGNQTFRFRDCVND